MSNAPEFCHNTTLIPNESSNAYLSECLTEKRLGDFLRICLPLIILPISLLSNCLSYFALRSRHIRGTSTAFFMLVLSVLDPLVLITKNLVYFPTLIISNSISCQILYFLIYVLGYTNVWILVIMTADKFLAVWFPLKVSKFCTIKRAKYVCILLLILTSLISFHHFWTINSLTHPKNIEQHFCYYDIIRYGSFQRIWRYIDFLIWCFIPFILILTLSILIIYKLHQNRKNSNLFLQQRFSTTINRAEVEKRFRLNKQKITNQNVKMRSNQNTEVIRSRHRHITLMLLAVAAVFLILTLPNSIYFVLEITYNFNKPPIINDYNQWLRYHRLQILTVIMFQLSDLQHATNFFLYLLTSNRFRRSVIRICRTIPNKIFSLLTCSHERQQNFHQKLYQNQYNLSPNLSYKRTQQERIRAFYRYHSIQSKSLTTTMELP